MSAVGMQALWVSGCVVLCVELYMCVSSELQRVFCFRCLQEDRQHSTFLDALHPTQDHPSPINIVGNYTQRRIDDTRNQLTASENEITSRVPTDRAGDFTWTTNHFWNRFHEETDTETGFHIMHSVHSSIATGSSTITTNVADVYVE